MLPYFGEHRCICAGQCGPEARVQCRQEHTAACAVRCTAGNALPEALVEVACGDVMQDAPGCAHLLDGRHFVLACAKLTGCLMLCMVHGSSIVCVCFSTCATTAVRTGGQQCLGRMRLFRLVYDTEFGFGLVS